MGKRSKISFADVNKVDLKKSVQAIEGQHIADGTRSTYDSRIGVYQGFLEARGKGEEVLPLNPDLIKECFAYLVDYAAVDKMSYIKQILAALRNHARENGYIESVALVETDLKKTCSKFAHFYQGLKAKLPENLGTPKKAVPSEVAQGTIRNIEEHETNLELASRDIMVISCGFACGLRGGEIALQNRERVIHEPVEKRYLLKILGKTNRTKARDVYMDEAYESFNFKKHHDRWTSHVDQLYEEQSITPDADGRKLYIITFDKRKTGMERLQDYNGYCYKDS